MAYKDKATRLAAQRRYVRGDGKLRHRANTRRWKLNNPEKVKESQRKTLLKWKYKITQQQWDALFASQGSRCAICRTDKPNGRHKAWCTDHCHATGLVRGILCNQCNVMVGFAGDSGAVLRAAVSYLEAPEW